jgi:hypothetical protein
MASLIFSGLLFLVIFALLSGGLGLSDIVAGLVGIMCGALIYGGVTAVGRRRHS